MKKVSASVGLIINFMASRSCVDGKLKSFVPKLPRKTEKYKIYSFLSSHKFSINAARLHSGGIEIFSGSTLVSSRSDKDSDMFLPFCSDKKKIDN